MYGWGHRRVALADLIAFAWSAPMRDLATRMQMSDVGLKKLLRTHGVSGPPQGHWNRVHAGRPVSEPPAAPARRPGEKPYIHVDGRFVDLPEAPLPLSAGPFASAKVPGNWPGWSRAIPTNGPLIPQPGTASRPKSLNCRRPSAALFSCYVDGPSSGHPLGQPASAPFVKDYERCAQTLAGLHIVAFDRFMMKQAATLAAGS